MPTAICSACGRILDYHNSRGTRLADFKCPKCRGVYRRATYDHQKQAWVPVKPRPTKGPQALCVLCGRRRFINGAQMYFQQGPFLYRPTYWASDIHDGDRCVLNSAHICAWHRRGVTPIDRPSLTSVWLSELAPIPAAVLRLGTPELPVLIANKEQAAAIINQVVNYIQDQDAQL